MKQLWLLRSRWLRAGVSRSWVGRRACHRRVGRRGRRAFMLVVAVEQPAAEEQHHQDGKHAEQARAAVAVPQLGETILTSRQMIIVVSHVDLRRWTVPTAEAPRIMGGKRRGHAPVPNWLAELELEPLPPDRCGPTSNDALCQVC